MPSRSTAALQTTLNALAARFADELLAAFAAARFGDMLTTFARPTSSQGAVVKTPAVSVIAPRRSRALRATRTDRIDALGRLIAYVGKHPGGVRAEQLRRELALAKATFTRAAADGIATGELRKEGRLRRTTYFAG